MYFLCRKKYARHIFNFCFSRVRQVFHSNIVLVEPNFVIFITLHNFVHRRDGIHKEDTVMSTLGDVNEKKS